MTNYNYSETILLYFIWESQNFQNLFRLSKEDFSPKENI